MWVRAGVLMLAVLVGLTGCGSASVESPPSGVDELVIPTPSPDPADFVGTVDNPWFPLPPGTTWTYAVVDATGQHPMTVTVERGPVVAGVSTTARISREGTEAQTDWFAQDRSGNVWWFGREDSWTAGVDGAEAGLAMPATPRVGDGYRPGLALGVSEDIAYVAALHEPVEVAAGSFEALLVEQRSELEPGLRESSYVDGVGLVEDRVVSGSYRTARLVRVSH
jgi:hypothetical protein